MQNVRELILNTARASVGIQENSPEHHFIVDKYNSIYPYPRGYRLKYCDSWCAAFVTYCADMNEINDFPRECGVFEMYKLFQTRNSYNISNKPQKGMPVFYNYSHMGVVEDFDGQNIYTIEGNANNSVIRQMHERFAGYIMGYGHWETNNKPNIELLAREVIAGKWGNNPQRQKDLEAAGYNYIQIQKEVNKMLGG